MRSNKGIALVTALIFMAVLAGIMSLMFTATLGELTQSRASVGRAQALAVAEAGEVYADHVLQRYGTTLLTELVQDEIDDFAKKNKSAKTEAIIPATSLRRAVANSFQNSLNTVHNSLAFQTP